MRHRTDLGPHEYISAWVSGDGPAVVLIHGIPGSSAVWRHVVDRLAPSHRVIVPDLVGFGASGRCSGIDDLWADRQAGAVCALLDDLGVGPSVIAGHDFGGPVAIHMLGREPERACGLVLAATNTFGDTPIPFPLSGILWPVVGRLWERLLFSAPSLRMMVRQGVGGDGPRLDPTASVGDREQARAIRVLFATALRELRERYEPITELLGEIAVPTTVVWGDRDPFFPLAQGRRTAAAIPGAGFVALPGAGHFLPEERPYDLAEVIESAS